MSTSGTDWNLRVRILAGLATGVTIPAAVVYAVATAVVGASPLLGVGAVPVAVVAGLSAVGLGVAAGPPLLLRASGAVPASEAGYPDLPDRVQRVADRLDAPTPAVAVAGTAFPQAFAVGRSRAGATLVVSEGAIEAFDDELDAVLAQQVAAVEDRGAVVAGWASGPLVVTDWVATAVRGVLRWGSDVESDATPPSSDTPGRHAGMEAGASEGSPGSGGLLGAVVLLLVYVPGMLVLGAVTLVRTTVLWAVGPASRRAVAVADRRAARAIDDPQALVDALRTVRNQRDGLDDRATETPVGTDPPSFVPGDASLAAGGVVGLLTGATHPPVERRIERVEDVAERSG